jgi:hypothetical protein
MCQYITSLFQATPGFRPLARGNFCRPLILTSLPSSLPTPSLSRLFLATSQTRQNYPLLTIAVMRRAVGLWFKRSLNGAQYTAGFNIWIELCNTLQSCTSLIAEEEEDLIRGGLLDPISLSLPILFSHFEIYRHICMERETRRWGEDRLNDFINCIFYRPGSYNASLHD